jgi:hypothetical protein
MDNFDGPIIITVDNFNKEEVKKALIEYGIANNKTTTSKYLIIKVISHLTTFGQQDNNNMGFYILSNGDLQNPQISNKYNPTDLYREAFKSYPHQNITFDGFWNQKYNNNQNDNDYNVPDGGSLRKKRRKSYSKKKRKVKRKTKKRRKSYLKKKR